MAINQNWTQLEWCNYCSCVAYHVGTYTKEFQPTQLKSFVAAGHYNTMRQILRITFKPKLYGHCHNIPRDICSADLIHAHIPISDIQYIGICIHIFNAMTHKHTHICTSYFEVCLEWRLLLQYFNVASLLLKVGTKPLVHRIELVPELWSICKIAQQSLMNGWMNREDSPCWIKGPAHLEEQFRPQHVGQTVWTDH